jgi:hypothetical protein
MLRAILPRRTRRVGIASHQSVRRLDRLRAMPHPTVLPADFRTVSAQVVKGLEEGCQSGSMP